MGIWDAVAFLAGAVVGSFLNVCIVRLPEGESLLFPGSRCRSCADAVAWYDNVPLLSYLLLRGRCRRCGARFSPRYFLVELLSAVLAVAVLRRFGMGVSAVGLFVFVCSLIVVTFVDLAHQIIPDVISLPGVVAGLLFSIVSPHVTPQSALLGALLGAGVLLAVALGYRAVRGEEGMGLGDVKLLAMIGAFLGWKAVPFTLIVASFAGSIVGVGAMFWRKAGARHPIPFGPFLSFGGLCHMFFGREIIGWYLGWF